MSAKPNYKTCPPTWCRDARPSKRGWHDPKTGELLVAIRGIQLDAMPALNEVPAAVPALSEEVAKPVLSEVVEGAPVMADEEEEETIPEEATDKPRRGRRSKKA